jgi:ABC-type sugar transport systems, permease components
LEKQEKRREGVHLKDKIAAYLFTFPVVVTLILLLAYPFGYGIYISFFQTNLIKKWRFVGFDNYINTFLMSEFWQSLGRTLIFTVAVVLGHFIIGFLFALILNREMKGRTFFRVILLLPWLFSEVVVATLWKWIFHPTNGILNGMLVNMGLIDKPLSWLGSPQFAMMTVILICIWKGYPLIMIQLLAGLQTISKDINEAATIDGANTWTIFWHITIPTLKPTLVVTILLDTVWWFKHVTIIWLLTQGGPGSSTDTIAVDIYKQAFEYFDFGTAAAIAVLVFLICVVFSLGYRRIAKDE